MELFDQIKVVVDLQNQALSSGVELGRSESAARIAFLEERNAKLLEVLKVAHEAIATLSEDALGVGSHGDLKWPIRDELLDTINKAINEKGE